MGPLQFVRKLLVVIVIAVIMAVLLKHNGPVLFVHKLLGLF